MQNNKKTNFALSNLITETMKTRVFVLALISALIMVQGCTKQKVIVPTTGAKVDLTLTIDSPSPATKTTIIRHTEDGKDYFYNRWTANDRMGIYMDNWANGDKPALEMTNTSSSEEKGLFEGLIPQVLDGSHCLYAFYPTWLFEGVQDGHRINMEIPDSQYPGVDTFDPKADIVMGKEYDIVVKTDQPHMTISNMSFSRILATVQVAVYNKATSVDLSKEKIHSISIETFMPGAALTGTIQWNFDNQTITVIDGSSEVEADLTTPVGIDTDEGIFLVVNPVTLAAGSKLVCEIETDKYEITKSTASLPMEVSFKSGKISLLKINITDSDCTFGIK